MKIQHGFLALWLVLGTLQFASVSKGETEGPGNQSYRRASKLYFSGDLEGANQECIRGLLSDPGNLKLKALFQTLNQERSRLKQVNLGPGPTPVPSPLVRAGTGQGLATRHNWGVFWRTLYRLEKLEKKTGQLFKAQDVLLDGLREKTAENQKINAEILKHQAAQERGANYFFLFLALVGALAVYLVAKIHQLKRSLEKIRGQLQGLAGSKKK